MKKKPLTFIINEISAAYSVMTQVNEAIKKGMQSGPVTVTLGRPSKSRLQEEKYHSMIGDIADSVEIIGRKYDAEVWKALLVDSFEQDLLSQGESLRHPSKTVVTLDGMRAVTIRASTIKFLKSEAGDFIEYLYSYGSGVGAVFTEKSLSIYEQYKEANL